MAIVTSVTLASIAAVTVTVGKVVALAGLATTLVGVAVEDEGTMEAGKWMAIAGTGMTVVGLGMGAVAGAANLSATGTGVGATEAGQQAANETARQSAQEAVSASVQTGASKTVTTGVAKTVPSAVPQSSPGIAGEGAKFAGDGVLERAWSGITGTNEASNAHISNFLGGTPEYGAEFSAGGEGTKAASANDPTLYLDSGNIPRQNPHLNVSGDNVILTKADGSSMTVGVRDPVANTWHYADPNQSAGGGWWDSTKQWMVDNPMATSGIIQGGGAGLQGYAQHRSSKRQEQAARDLHASASQIPGGSGDGRYRRPTNPAAPPDRFKPGGNWYG